MVCLAIYRSRIRRGKI